MPDLSSLLLTWIPQVSEALGSCSERLCAKLPQHQQIPVSVLRWKFSPPAPSPFTSFLSFLQLNKEKGQQLAFPKSYKGLETPSERRLSDSPSGYPSHGSMDPFRAIKSRESPPAMVHAGGRGRWTSHQSGTQCRLYRHQFKVPSGSVLA